MSVRDVNLFSANQSNFGVAGGTDNAGWEVTSTYGRIVRLDDSYFYEKYNPNSTFPGRTLAWVTNSTADITIKSDWIPIESSQRYMASVFYFQGKGDADVTLDMEFNNTNSGTGDTYATDSSLTAPTTITFSTLGDCSRLFHAFTARVSDKYARMVFKISGGSGGNLADTDGGYFYDPVICEDGFNKIGRVSYKTYQSLPAFMRLDDEKINDIVADAQMSVPLRRYLESLASYGDMIADEAAQFDYTRAEEGTESKSKLTDPDTAASAYLAWLASVTATTLLVSSSGFTPWSALESYDGGDAGSDPGEWTDIESFSDWLALQASDPDFFDTVQSFRDQIRTGFTGIHSGRADTVEAFVRTMLSSATASTDAVSVNSNNKDNPFLVEVLVDPNSDPDASGSLVIDAVNNGLSAGAVATKVGQVIDSGNGAYSFTDVFYPATVANSSGGGVVMYGPSFIADKDGFARNILLNSSVSAALSEVGGGIGYAHYSTGSEYYFGKITGSTFGSLTTASTTYADIGGNTAGFDLIAVLTDVTVPTASVDSAGSGGNTPADWLYREKRLIACGVDSDSQGDNDWALYLVSGATAAVDNDTRMLLVEGFNAVGATNYAASDPIDFSTVGNKGDVVLRVKRGAVSGTASVTFYAQSSLYDDWEGNKVGTATITPASSSAGNAHARLQILGKLDASDNWADANPLSCGVKRFMLFKTPLTFTGDSDTSTNNHAYIDGDATKTYGKFTYSPSIDVDLSDVSVYTMPDALGTDQAFNASTPDSGTVSVDLITDGTSSGSTGNKVLTGTHDFDVLAMRRIGGTTDTWYFGHAASGGDTLTINGLSNSTAYDVIPRVVNTTTGGASNVTHSLTTNGSGVLTITATTIYDGGSATYGGTTLNQIAVQPSGGGSNVAKFLPTTIGTGATTGADSVDANNTWTLTRNFPASSVAYAPSQLVNKESIHMYEGTPTMHNPPEIEAYHPFSVAMQVRRFWTASAGTDYSIFKLLNAANQGLHIYYDGPAIKATFTDGIATETVTWTESPTYGSWHEVVVRRDADIGFSLVINGTEQSTASSAVGTTFSSATSSASFGEGAAGAWNARFGLAQFAYFNRRLSDAEITLMNSQIT